MGQYVKYYSSGESGAPVLDNTAGSVVNLFDAILVNGFGSKTLTSLAVSSNVATAVVSGGHQFDTVATSDKDITIAGSTPSLLNGVKQVTIVNSTTFTFPAPGVADGTATGTITAKRSPLGWTKAFAGTNKAIYKSSDISASSSMIRVADTTASSVEFRVVGCETATDVDTYTNPFPNNTQVSGGMYWIKGANTTRAKNWTIIGDTRFFYFIVESSSYTDSVTFRNSYWVHTFGDFNSLRPSDTSGSIINGSSTTLAGSSNGPVFVNSTSLNSYNDTALYNMYIARDYLLTTISQKCNISWPLGLSPGASNRLYPNVVNQGLSFIEGPLITEYSVALAHPIRGVLPGAAAPLAYGGYITGADSPLVFTTTNGKKYLGFVLMYGAPVTYFFAINVTDNWRG